MSTKLDAVFRDAADPIMIEDLSGKVIDLNREAVRAYGWTRAEIVGQPIKQIVPSQRHPQADELLQKCLSGADVRNAEGLRVAKDGTVYVVLLTLSLLRDENGDPFAIASIAKDITSLRASQTEAERLSLEIAARNETEQQLAAALDEVKRVNFQSNIALELTGCGYWHVDYSDPEYYFQSDRAANILGEPLKPDGRYHLQEEWFSRLVEANPATAELTSERYQGAIEGRYPSYESTYAYKRPCDGKIVWIHALGKVVRDRDEKIQYMYGVYRDITQEKLAELERKESNQRFELALNATGMGLWDVDTRTERLVINDQWAEMIGYRKDEIPERLEALTSRIHPDDADRVAGAYQKHVQERAPYYEMEFRMRAKDGSYRWILSMGKAASWDADGKPTRVIGTHLDITERKQAVSAIREAKQNAEQFAEELQRSRTLNQGLLDATDAVIYVKDLDGRYMLVNQEWTRVLGRSAEATIGRTDFDFQPPDVAAALVANDRQVIENGKPIQIEETPDDGPDARRYMSNKFPLFDPSGKIYALGGVSTDISEFKHQEEALQKSQERFDLTVRGSGDGLWDHNPETGEMWFSDRFRELLGYTNEQEYPNVAESWSDGLHPEDREATLEAFAAHLAGDVPYDVEYRLKTKSGPYRWYRARGISLRDDLARSYRAAGSITDVTDQKLAEQALAAAEQRSRSLLESAPDGMMISDEQGRIAIVNAQFEVLFGYAKSEIVGQPIEVLLPERFRHGHVAQRTSFFRSPSLRQMGSSLELFARRKDGTEFPVEISLSPLTTDEGVLVSSSIRDISERKRAETELIKARTEAEAANQAKSDFLANMSHEIRTPMNGIMGMTELALGTELSTEQREFLTTIESSADSLLSLINDILDFSKIEAKKLELDPVPFALRERIGETLSTLAVRAHSKGLELAFEVEPDVPESLVGDVHRIRQILVNLLGNAIKFTEQGEIVVGVRLVKRSDEDATIRFSISDTGIGLPTEKLETIFQPFEQADVSTTRKYGGTGLGLAICVRLVELMGGEMNVESEVGSGTTFSFTADLRIGHPSSVAPPKKPPQELRGMNVLVVDDNETNRRILAKMLKNWGMVPVVVDSAAEGLQALRSSAGQQPIELVLSDVNMPEMDGFMFAERVKANDALKHTPIILLTSANRSGDGTRCRELGIAAHLIKPARQSFLFDAIATTVGANDVDETHDRETAKPQTDSHPQGLRLLLAEDNEVNQKFAVRALTKAGHSVSVAGNGQLALDAWDAEEFDVVLMDIQMPVMDGYLATAEIRQREATSGRHTPIVAMTAHAMKGDKEKCLDAGMDGYVTKPIKSKLMLAEISRVIAEFPRQDVSGSREEKVDDPNA